MNTIMRVYIKRSTLIGCYGGMTPKCKKKTVIFQRQGDVTW